MRLVDSNRVTYGEKITDRIWLDTNKQLICRDCIIARTGSYDYLESEIIANGDKNKIVKVFRTDDEVFNPISIASFENKPFVDDHPQDDVAPDNVKHLSKGYMRDVRRGTGELSNCLLCDIVVTDPETIDDIVSGRKRELSLGYNTVIVKRNGEYEMTQIRGNHLALVTSGRAGCATIRDSAKELNRTGGKEMSKTRRKVTLFDEDIFEVEEIKEDNNVLLEEEAAEEPIVVAEDNEPTIADCYAILKRLEELLTPKAEEEVIPEVLPEEPALDEDPIEEEVEQEEVEDIVDNEDTTEGELLDADEILAEKETKANDAKSVYSKFAKVTDTRSNIVRDEVTESFKNRYAQLAGLK